MALRWKKQKKVTGLASVVAGPVSSDLHDGETKYATVYAKRDHYYTAIGWYFVTHSEVIEYENTCNNLVETEEQAKIDARAFVVARLKEMKDE